MPAGFTPTELGLELLRIADATHGQFGELKRLANTGDTTLAGHLKITSVDVLTPVVMPLIAAFQDAYPKVQCRFFPTDQVFKLEYGEADIAFRIGPKPSAPDNVVIKLASMQMGLFVAKSYVEDHGLPQKGDLLKRHRFVGPEDSTPSAPFVDWLRAHVPSSQLALTSPSIATLLAAVDQGIGIGFLPKQRARQNPNLIELPDVEAELAEPIWMVTHVDLHRSAKVQAFVASARQSAPQSD